MATSTSSDTEPIEMSAVEIQQDYFEVIGDVDWERYELRDRPHLLQKIAIALCGSPSEEGDLMAKQTDLKLQGYDRRSEEIIMTIFKKICEQAKYSHNGENIYLSIIRVVCVAPANKKKLFGDNNYWVNLHEKKGKDVNICIFHVFSIRKCISMQPDVKSCRIFIDHDARVYKDWKSYLEENRLPEGVLIVPENGEYRGIVQNELLLGEDIDMPKVILTVVPSPALGLGVKILNIADTANHHHHFTANTVAGVGAVVGAVALMATPIAAPVIGSVLIVGAVTSVYGIVRSGIVLADRGKHHQSISLKNSESRASWINIFVSTAGLSFTAAGKLLSWAAASGTNVRVLLNAVQFLKHTTIAGGLIGIVNSFGEMIHKYTKYQELPTKLELFQFTSALLFFGIGVMSNKTAQEIVEESQAKSLNNIRESLSSKAKRKIFDKVTAETRRLHGTIKGNAEVIKGLKVITDRNEFFGHLSKMNKQFNQNKLRISMSSDGVTMINNYIKMTVSELNELGKIGRDKLFATFGPAEVTSKNVSTKRLYSVSGPSTTHTTQSVLNESVCYIRPEELIKIANFIQKLRTTDQDYICEILSEISSQCHQAFLLLCAELIGVIPKQWLSFLEPIVKYVYEYLQGKCGTDDDNDGKVNIGVVLGQYLRDGRIKPESIKILKENVMKWLDETKTKNNHNDHLKNYNGLYPLGKMTQKKKYFFLECGTVVKIGEHEILIKNETVQYFKNWLEHYSQDKTDLILEFCLKIVKEMSAEEIKNLNLVNPDEDVLIRIADYIISFNLTDRFLEMYENNNNCTVHHIKLDIVRYGQKKMTRQHVTCKVCFGFCYQNK